MCMKWWVRLKIPRLFLFMGNTPPVSKFVEWAEDESIISVATEVPIEIKQSIFIGSTKDDLGVFATEFIPANTYICKSNPRDVNEDSIARKINDPDYKGSALEYEQIEHNPNLVYVNTRAGTTYLKTCKDIQAGEELTRHYGCNYWFQYEYYKKHNAVLQAGNIPSDYVFLSNYRVCPTYNMHLKIFVKCVNGVYSYVAGFGIPHNYYFHIEKFNKLPLFKSTHESEEEFKKSTIKEFWEHQYLIDVSNPDGSPYPFDKPICLDGQSYWRDGVGL